MKRLLLVPLVLLHVSAFAAEKNQTTGSGGAEEGRALIDENCLDCHDDSYITPLNLGREQWGGGARADDWHGYAAARA